MDHEHSFSQVPIDSRKKRGEECTKNTVSMVGKECLGRVFSTDLATTSSSVSGRASKVDECVCLQQSTRMMQTLVAHDDVEG